MDCWIHIHFTGMGLQIASALLGGGIGLKWLRVANGSIYIDSERVKWVKRFSYILLWTLAIGFILELWYEAHLL